MGNSCYQINSHTNSCDPTILFQNNFLSMSQTFLEDPIAVIIFGHVFFTVTLLYIFLLLQYG
jgi:hypothetical protein